MFIVVSHRSRLIARIVSRITSFTCVASLSITVACNTSAQIVADDTNFPQTLSPIVVTAARIKQPQADALPSTTFISSDDIRNSQAADLLTLLRDVAGIQLTQSGGPGQAASLFMRGAQPGESLILIDGVPVRRQGFSPAPAIEHILPEQIDHIEIVRGNVSAIYGSSAMGGVIQIFTKQGKGPATMDLSLEFGSRGTRELTTGLSGQADDTRYALTLSSFRADGFSANSLAQYPNENPDNNGDRNTSFSANISHEWATEHELGLRAYANDGKYSFDGGGFGAPTDTNLGQSQQQSLAVFSKDRLTTNWLSTVTLSQTATRNENMSISAFAYTIHDNGDTRLLQWSNEVKLASNWTVVAGLDAGREKLDSMADYGFGATTNAYSRSTSSLYAGLNGKIDAHQLQANVRHDDSGGSGADTTWYLGYGYSLTRSVKLTATASTAFNAPSLAQLDDASNGNPALQSERSKSYELGAQYAIGASMVRATVFNTRTRNQFSIDPNNCFSGSYLNSCPTFNLALGSNQGVELSASGRVADFDTRATLTLQSPKNDVTDEILIRRARTMGSLSMSKSVGAWRFGSGLQYAGSRTDTDFVSGNKKELNAYWLANFNLHYQLAKSASIFGRIDNIFNSDYQTVYGNNQPPRGVFVGLSWRL